MDIVDRAQQIEERIREKTLAIPMNSFAGASLVIDEKRCCTDCDKPIPLKRLEVIPGAVRCVGCQTEYEGR